jgi:Rrf2 family protein
MDSCTSAIGRRDVRISAKAEYAVRAAVELAGKDDPVKGDLVAEAQGIPLKFLENILSEMRHAGLIRSQRGREGGYKLAIDAGEISLADIIRAVEGPLAEVHGEPPEEVHYEGSAEALEQVWIAVRANLRAVLEHVTVADVAEGSLPEAVLALSQDPDARTHR